VGLIRHGFKIKVHACLNRVSASDLTLMTPSDWPRGPLAGLRLAKIGGSLEEIRETGSMIQYTRNLWRICCWSLPAYS